MASTNDQLFSRDNNRIFLECLWSYSKTSKWVIFKRNDEKTILEFIVIGELYFQVFLFMFHKLADYFKCFIVIFGEQRIDYFKFVHVICYNLCATVSIN